MTPLLLMGDTLELMASLPDASVDAIICDLPYGTTACKWDSVIPFDLLWAQYYRVAKPEAPFVLFCAQPFTTALISSNLKHYRYNWTWLKTNITGFANAKRQPLRQTEDVAVFCRARDGGTYNPQGLVYDPKIIRSTGNAGGETMGGIGQAGRVYVQEFTNWPRNVLNYPRDPKSVHPTQKPVAMLEYLVQTYTNPGGVVLDNTMGSGTTGAACVNTGRQFIGIERDPKWYSVACDRILTNLST